MFPNVPAILLIGLVLGLGTGVGSAALKDYSDRSVRTAAALSSALALPVLAVIPEIVTSEDTARDAQVRRQALVAAVVVLIVAVALFHYLVMDLDELWAKIMRRIVI